MPEKKWKILPTAPGCYFFKNTKGDVIYVGKAKNIRKRVGSYFQKQHEEFLTQELVSRIHDIDFIVTSNEVEALLLEARMIQEHQPRYNIRLKDDKSYAYIKITNEAFPRLVIVRAKQTKEGEKGLYGPYTSAQARQEIIRLANSLFQLRVCKKLPNRACLLYHLHMCSAPCIGKITQEEYLKNVEKAKMLLRGDNSELVAKLNSEMREFSGKEKYEQAKISRDQIAALRHIEEKQKVHLRKTYNQDVINYLMDGTKAYLQIFTIHKGVISGRKDFVIENHGQSELELFAGFIRQYYYANDIPEEIIIPRNFSEKRLCERYLERMAKRKVRIVIPEKGDKRKLLDLLKENIIAKHQLGSVVLQSIAEKLGLPMPPRVIECFDISNLGPQDIVGSMVQFRDEKPDKNNYRRFKVRTVSGQSDVDAMKEIVFRRYSRLMNEQSELPQLVVIDGGKPQLNAALLAMRDAGAAIPTIALAKREEEIYTTNHMHTLRWTKTDPALKLLQRIRNEAHRFALKYHRLLRSKNI